MIDLQIIQAAQLIRRKYLNIIGEVDQYQEVLANLHEFLTNKMHHLKDIHDNGFKQKGTKDDVENITKLIIKEIEEIELEERRLVKKFEKVNNELEELKKEEKILYDKIKIKYPNLTDDQIITEIQKYLEE